MTAVTSSVSASTRDHGRELLLEPQRLVVLRDGLVRRSIPLADRLDLADLPRLVHDPAYVSTSPGGVITLRARLEQRPGSRMVGRAPALTQLRFAGGSELSGDGAGLRLSGVTISSTSSTSPRLRYTHGSSVQLTDSVVRGFGSTGSVLGERPGRAALEITDDSDVRLDDVQIVHGTSGLRLDNAGTAVLRRVSVRRASGPGITINGGAELTLDRVLVKENAGPGLTIRGPVAGLTTGNGQQGRVDGSRSIIQAIGNAGAGVRLSQLVGSAVGGISTRDNAGTGLELRDSKAVELSGLHSEADLVGLGVIDSSLVTVRDLTASGAATGLAIRGGSGNSARGVLVLGARAEAVAVDTRNVELRGVRVTSSGAGIVIGPQAGDVMIADAVLAGRRSALWIGAGAVDVRVRHLRARAPGAVAVQVAGARVTLADVAASGAIGVRAEPGASVQVVDGTIDAIMPTSGYVFRTVSSPASPTEELVPRAWGSSRSTALAVLFGLIIGLELVRASRFQRRKAASSPSVPVR